MLYEAEDTTTRAAARLRKVSEHGSKEVREIIEQFNSRMLEEMSVSLSSLVDAINALLKCDTLYSNEKYAVLDLFYDLVADLLRRKETLDLKEIPVSLGNMKFTKNEKNVERAVVVYLKVIVLLLDIVDTPEHRTTIFKVFCTLFMSKSFISSTKCGYLLPSMFKEFLIRYPEFIESLLDNQDRLVYCPALLEIVLMSCQKMDKVVSKLAVLDFIKRKNNRLVVSLHGKGFYEPFFFQIYMEREDAPFSEVFPLFCKGNFLEYLFLDVSTRITSRDMPRTVLEKIKAAGYVHFTRMLKDPGESTECAYCEVAQKLHETEKRRREIFQKIDEFNVTAEVHRLVQMLEQQGSKSAYREAAMLLRSHAETNLASLGKCLGKEDSAKFLDAFCTSFNFSEYDILTALRVFLLSFNLPGEGQKIERIIFAFCKKYSEDGKQNVDTVLSIAMSIIFLNTSIHNVNTAKKFTVEDFTQIILRDCKDVDVEYLESLYAQVKQEKLQLPVSNTASAEMLEFLEQQGEADACLHPAVSAEKRYRYCGKCTQAVYRYAIEEYKIGQAVAKDGTSSEVMEYVRACMRIDAADAAIEAVKLVRDPFFVVKVLDEFAVCTYSLWSTFLDALEKMYQLKDEPGSTPRFFRGIFAFGKDAKKDKREAFPDDTTLRIIEGTRNINDAQAMDMAGTLAKKIEERSSKILNKVAYSMVKVNADRMFSVGVLLKTLIGNGGASVQEIVALCEASSLSNVLQVLLGIKYKPSKHITAAVIALLQYVISVLSQRSPSIVEMHGVKDWMAALISSEAFKLRNSEIVISIWETVEEIALRVDSAGFDGFEIFIKMKEVITKASKLEIISNTRMYYRNINRVLLCLDILSGSSETDLKDAFVAMVSLVVEKDALGCVSVLESCEHVLETIPDIQKRIEETVLDKTQGVPNLDVKYLKKLVMKMSLKASPSKEIVDL
ncbi:uncharacterized protein NEMAJ01_0951 [Nematocida major]|uniref:uncharacterized protein n=1 Tax=Nematocida major TaxID=1912982 RepID=UPI002007E3A9|nr:uncharacterized protein NEMAJ01_0951 [Nematocida major]KAH9386055.1 hypothetical protein NEMAJ01_0951 [Nematocida major]